MDDIHPLRAWRKAQEPKMTLAKLAEEIGGVTPSHLSEIESGNNVPSLELAVKLSNVTGIDVAQFAGRRRVSGEVAACQ